VYNFKHVNVSGIQFFPAQLLALNLGMVMFNAANIYQFGFIHTKCKYIDRSFLNPPVFMIIGKCFLIFVPSYFVFSVFKDFWSGNYNYGLHAEN